MGSSEKKTSEVQKRANSKYLKSDRGKATLARYRKSAKGKAAQARAEEKRKNDPDRLEKNREYARAFRAREKAKKEALSGSATDVTVVSEPDEVKREQRRAYQREWMRRKREELRASKKDVV